MSHIHSKDTKPEIILRKALWKKGVRYRKNFKKLPGSPDIAITKYKIAVFVDGEFWHGYNWENKKESLKHNRSYWISKIENNMKRDKRNDCKLQEANWSTLHFWSLTVKNHTDYCVERILLEIRGRT